ncbi:MAG TPA: AAA family ATPase [Candidatus Pacearchaeota archaeon]|nr:AAA family ATPase [Candidatus Pacearchaeota archaeon]
MARVICVINNKGGVGKTNVCVNLSAFLAGFGKKTLLVDFDHQANATFSVGIKSETLPLSIYNALMGDVESNAVVKSTSILGFDILPSNQDLAGANVELISLKDREFRLDKALDNVRLSYDFIIIDTPPSLGVLTINALCAADEVIIPIQSEYLALEGLHQIQETIRLVQENLGHEFKFVGTVLTMYNRGNIISRDVSKELRRGFTGYIFDAVIPRSTALAAAPKYGKPVLQYDPNSKAAQAYRFLAQEVIQLEAKIQSENQTHII